MHFSAISETESAEPAETSSIHDLPFLEESDFEDAVLSSFVLSDSVEASVVSSEILFTTLFI